MKKAGMVAFTLLLTAISLFAEYTGKISENIVMTSTKGEKIDLFEKLDSGMHVLFFATSAT